MQSIKQALGIFALAALCWAVPALSHGEEFDIGSMTCQEFVTQASEEEMVYIIYWIDGYMSRTQNNNIVDSDELQENLQIIIAHCQNNPNDKVLALVQ